MTIERAASLHAREIFARALGKRATWSRPGGRTVRGTASPGIAQASGTAMDVFVYGTLTNPALVRSLTGRTFPHEAARLPGYRRFEPTGSYPYILPCAGGVVTGTLLCDLDEPALEQLDQYEDEGDLYVRTAVTVETSRGPRRCLAYVANPPAIGRLRLA